MTSKRKALVVLLGGLLLAGGAAHAGPSDPTKECQYCPGTPVGPAGPGGYEDDSSPWGAPWTDMVSVDSNEVQGLGESDTPAISADGKTVAFFSLSDLAPGADRGVFVRETGKGTTVWVSDPAQLEGQGGTANFPTISGDGRLVAFGYSYDGPKPDDVYVHDRDADADGVFDEPGETSMTLVSVGAESGSSSRPYISADGRYVAFTSHASIVAEDDDGGLNDVYRHDLQTGTTELVSVATTRGIDDDARATSISAKGQLVAFDGEGSNLVAGDANGAIDVFVRDMDASTTTLASVGIFGQADEHSYQGSLSGDGTLVAFTSTATNLGGDHYTGGYLDGEDVYVRDLTNGHTKLISSNVNGKAADGPSRFPALSADGSRIAFASEATNLIETDPEGKPDVFSRGLSRATQVDDEATAVTIVLEGTIRVSEVKGTGGDRASGMGYSDKFYRAPAVSSDGMHVSYTTMASNLTVSDVNGKTTDVLLRYLGWL